MKKLKINLKELRVESFETKTQQNSKGTAYGNVKTVDPYTDPNVSFPRECPDTLIGNGGGCESLIICH